jgi:ABC-type multidrug transport system fused ATPase/permease subunit
MVTECVQNVLGDVRMDAVQFTYASRPDVAILRQMSFNLRAGRSLALVGPSGCGKSTVVSLMERFYDAIDGTVVSGTGQRRARAVEHITAY